MFLFIRQRSKSYVRVCIASKAASMPLLLWREQSPKNIKASSKSRDMHKYNMLYTIKFIEHVLTPESIS